MDQGERRRVTDLDRAELNRERMTVEVMKSSYTLKIAKAELKEAEAEIKRLKAAKIKK